MLRWLIITSTEGGDSALWPPLGKALASQVNQEGTLSPLDLESFAILAGIVIVNGFRATRERESLRRLVAVSRADPARPGHQPKAWVHFGGVNSRSLHAADITERWLRLGMAGLTDLVYPFSLRAKPPTSWDECLREVATKLRQRSSTLQEIEGSLAVAWEEAARFYDVHQQEAQLIDELFPLYIDFCGLELAKEACRQRYSQEISLAMRRFTGPRREQLLTIADSLATRSDLSDLGDVVKRVLGLQAIEASPPELLRSFCDLFERLTLAAANGGKGKQR